MLKVMHQFLTRKFIYSSFFLFFLAGCSTFHHDFKSKKIDIGEGVEYRVDNYLNQKIFVAKIDPQKAKVSLVKGSKPLEKPSTIAKREHAFITINAGYFQENGMPSGAYKENFNWVQKPKKMRGALGWTDSASSFYFDRLKTNNKGEVVSEFHQDTHWWEKQRYVVGGAPLLIYDGKALSPEPEKVLDTFLVRRYARTAICMDQNQKLLLVVVEGGDSLSWRFGFRNGLSMSELTEYLKTQNCVYALNLDGGKSSSMVVNGRVVNSQPHFFGEREVSDVITVSKFVKMPELNK